MKLDTVAHVDLNAIIEEHVRDLRPEIVYCVHPDINRDHQCLFDSALVAARPLPGSPVRRLVTYAPLSSTEWDAGLSARPFAPNLFVDIEKTLDVKIAAMNEFATELRDYPHPRSIEGIRVFAAREGSAVGVRFAEPFCIVRELA